MDLSVKRGTGAAIWQGHQTGNQLVQLEAGMTPLEVLATLQPGTDPAEERRMLARVLTLLLGLPLQPESSMGDVMTALEPICPHILWTKPEAVVGDGVPAGFRERRLMAVREGVMVEVWLRQDRLYAVKVTDLELMILNEDLPGAGEAKRGLAISENLASLIIDPVPFALKWCFYMEPGCLEWSRGIGTPNTAPEPKPAKEAEEGAIGLPAEPAGRDVPDFASQDTAHEALREHRNFGRRHGSLRELLEQAADGDLLRECAALCDGPEAGENAYPRSPDFARVTAVLHSLYDHMMRARGLESWLTSSLEEAPDALVSLGLTGAVEMEQFLTAFVTRASETGCDIESEESWEEYFAGHPCTAEGKEALRLTPAIVPLFRTWALNSPDVPVGKTYGERRSGVAAVSLTRNTLLSGFEGVLQKAAGGRLGKATRGLWKMAARLMPGSERKD
jgi:hypothetical protein